MNDLPDFKSYCEAACRKLWGEPSSATTKELRWNGADAYGGKTFNKLKRVWYDRDAQVGGSTLELVAHSNGGLNGKLTSERFVEVWRKAHTLGVVPEAPPEKHEKLSIRRTYPYHDETGKLLYEVMRIKTVAFVSVGRSEMVDGPGARRASVESCIACPN